MATDSKALAGLGSKLLTIFGWGVAPYWMHRRQTAGAARVVVQQLPPPSKAPELPGVPVIAIRQDGVPQVNFSAPPASVPVAPPPPPPAPAPPPTPVGPNAEEIESLSAHNSLRARLGIGPLVWDAELAREAQAWANHLCELNANNPGRPTLNGNPILHKPDNPRGENIYWMRTSGSAPSMAYAVERWATEEANYDASSNACVNGICGHWTQIVWRNSQRMGCAKATCNGQTFVVCEYDPPGNYRGQRPY